MTMEGPVPSSLELGRRAFRRRQTTRSVLIGAASTVVFAIVLWVALVSTPGWPVVQHTFFDPETALASLPKVAEGFVTNIRVLLVAAAGVLILSLAVAAIRTLRGPVFFPLRALAAGYTDLFRGMPLIIVLYLIGYGVPALRFSETRIPAEVLGTIALILTYSAYVSEVWRAGIEAVHPSQRLAARALGLGYGTTLRLVVLPQALRKVTPALMNDFVALQKDVALISIIGPQEAFRVAQIYQGENFNYTPIIAAALLYLVITVPLARLVDRMGGRGEVR